jgi:SH3-like domain-containing protein
LLLLVLVSCQEEAGHAPAIGEVFAGPSALPLRKDLSSKSAVNATAKHGDRLEVLEYKRRFVRVRTAEGKEGWTEVHLLLTPQQMAELRAMAQKSATLPSQGAATVFEQLNMHTQPSRTSPSFVQIPENAKVDVIAHRLTPRIQTGATSDAPVRLVRPRPVRRQRKDKQASGGKLPPPPTPPPPGPPRNWQALSTPTLKSLEAGRTDAANAPKSPEKPPVLVAMDDWSLIRTPDGKVGWVLTRMLSMSIPDEVAQYAEGHRITSYFALGQVRDGDAIKNNWLWTTIQKGAEPYEYDSFRVFVWSRNHHRYETAKIERNIVGHYPVLVDTTGSEPRFSIILEGTDDKFYRKTFTLEGNRVRFVEQALADRQKEPEPSNSVAETQPQQNAPAETGTSWLTRMKQKWFR